MHSLDSDMRLAPLHASVDELVSGFDSASEVDVLQRHGDWFECDHERVHHAAVGPCQRILQRIVPCDLPKHGIDTVKVHD